jgi:hypothetical protein
MTRDSICPGVSAILVSLILAIAPNATLSAIPCTTTADCDDNNPCTDDWCDPGVNECFYTNIADPCDDGNACTQNDVCNAGICAGTAINCNDGISCTTDTCVAGVCQHDDSACPCTTTADCDDGNPCTDDWCDPGVSQCIYTNNTDPCDDGDACTTDVCTAGACVGTPINCDDDIECTTDTCQDGLCQHDASACECTDSADCDDGNPCTNDWCDPADYQCYYTNNTDPCDDGNTCTVNDTCNAGTCVGTNNCSTIQTALCAPAAGGTALVTCLALLALQLCTRRHRPSERPRSDKR